MKKQNNNERSQDFTIDNVLGGPLIAVDEADEYGTGVNPVRHCCRHKNHAIELQDKLSIANEQLTEFHELLEAHEALKTRNKELESHITKKEDKSWEKLKHLSFSLDESPYIRIIELEEELKAVKLDLALARTREDWLKQRIHRKNLESNCPYLDEQQNQKLCPIGEKYLDSYLNETSQRSSLKLSTSTPIPGHDILISFPANRSHAGLQSNEPFIKKQVLASLSETITKYRNVVSSVSLSLASRTGLHGQESPFANSNSEDNSTEFSGNTRHLSIQSNDPSNVSRVLSGLRKTFEQIASSNIPSIASHTRFHSEEASSTSASWGDNSNAYFANIRSCLKSNERLNTSRVLAGLGKDMIQNAPSKKLSVASCIEADAREGISANAA